MSQRTDDEYLEALRELADKLDRSPRKRDMIEHGPYSEGPYYGRWGSWSTALEAAGLEPNWKRASEEELIHALQEFAAELGHPPTQQEMIDDGPYSHSQYTDRFGGWLDALEAAGLDPDERETKRGGAGGTLSREQLLEDLRAYADDLGCTPTVAEMRADGPYTEKPYVSRWGTWTDAIEAAGLEPNVSRPSDWELLNELRAFADELGRTPTSTDVESDGPYTLRTYLHRWDSWEETLEAAGLESLE